MVARRAPKPWRLPEETLDWAKQAKRDAEAQPNTRKDTAAARAALTRLRTEAHRARNFHAAALLRSALAVDMSKPLNRKGGLPTALGLVSRREKRGVLFGGLPGRDAAGRRPG